MLRQMLKGKIHCAKITEADLNYEGSLSVDTELLEKAGMYIGEKILVVNIKRIKSAERPSLLQTIIASDISSNSVGVLSK